MRILYEDDDLIFVDKPPGLVVQRSYDESEPVLIEMVQSMMEEKGEEAFLMQRLDRGTSGVIFFTKTSEVNRTVTRAFEKREIDKLYLALCEGRISRQQLIDAPIDRIGAIKFGVRSTGKESRTRLLPIEWNERRTLLALKLLTGRTHQIRVHLSAIGHPLVGDWLYGERDSGRPMLHAWSCSMPHPRTGSLLTVDADPAEDLVDAIRASGLQLPRSRPDGMLF